MLRVALVEDAAGRLGGRCCGSPWRKMLRVALVEDAVDRLGGRCCGSPWRKMLWIALVEDAVGRTALRWAEGVLLAAVGAEQKPETIALLKSLMDEAGISYEQ